MCGIVGVLGKGPVAGQLVDALKRLEYRGYDSAGVATVENGQLGRRRAEGKLRNLEARLKSAPLLGETGIGHTRWATHGKPTEANAHPHMTDDVSVVHNGIIENYRELKEELVAEGAAFTSDTDTEVIAHLVTRELRAGNDPVRAIFHTLRRLEGAFAIAMIFRGYNDLMIVARQGSPLAIGYGEGEMFVGSDALALAPFTDEVCYLEDGDWAVLTREGVAIRDRAGNAGAAAGRPLARHRASGRQGQPPPFHGEGDPRAARGRRPYACEHTSISSLGRVEAPKLPFDFAKLNRLSISACGTAFYAGLVAKYWFERWARLPVDVDIASEMRYRQGGLEPGGARPVHLAVGRDGRHARDAAALPRAGPERALHRQCAGIVHRARVRRHDPDARRSGDRRRLDQGLHLPAHRACLPRHRRRQGEGTYRPGA